MDARTPAAKGLSPTAVEVELLPKQAPRVTPSRASTFPVVVGLPRPWLLGWLCCCSYCGDGLPKSARVSLPPFASGSSLTLIVGPSRPCCHCRQGARPSASGSGPRVGGAPPAAPKCPPPPASVVADALGRNPAWSRLDKSVWISRAKASARASSLSTNAFLALLPPLSPKASWEHLPMLTSPLRPPSTSTAPRPKVSSRTPVGTPTAASPSPPQPPGPALLRPPAASSTPSPPLGRASGSSGAQSTDRARNPSLTSGSRSYRGSDRASADRAARPVDSATP